MATSISTTKLDSPNQSTATHTGYDSAAEITMQVATQRHFLRDRDQTWKYEEPRRRISNQMLFARVRAQEQSITVTGLPTRVLLVAERSIYPILFPQFPLHGDYYTNHQVVEKKSSPIDRGGLTAREAIQMENVNNTAFVAMTYRQSATRLHVNHGGNYFFNSLGTYEEIWEQVSTLRGKIQLPSRLDDDQAPMSPIREKDRKIAAFLLNFQ